MILKANHSSYHIYGLMAASIIGLLIFFSHWLILSYDQEREQLRRDSNFTLISVVRNVEDSLLNSQNERMDRILPSFNLNNYDSLIYDVRFAYAKDTLLKERLGRSSRKKIKVMGHGKRDLPGMIGYFALENYDMSSGANFSAPEIVMALIKEGFESARTDSDLPSSAVIQFDTTVGDRTAKILSSRSYNDMMTDTKAQVVIDNYNWFILQKIIPKILTSIGIVFLTILTFFILHRNLQKQKRLSEERASLMANITHELNTPITSAKLAIESLQNRKMSVDDQSDYLTLANGELNRLSVLVDKIMLGVSQTENSYVQKRRIELVGVANEVINSMKLTMEEMNGQITLHTESSEIYCMADDEQIRSVLQNLIENALKYSQPRPIISVDISSFNSACSLRIKDNGSGIPKQYQSQIFEPFYRVPTGNIHNVKGHGLGLNYVRNVVRAHGGQIKLVESNESGTTIEISLPHE